jgi:hypothetical protein
MEGVVSFEVESFWVKVAAFEVQECSNGSRNGGHKVTVSNRKI